MDIPAPSGRALTPVRFFQIIGNVMKAIRIDDRHMLRLVRGEEVMECLRSFMRLRSVPGGTLAGLGASDAMTVAFYDLVTKEYRPQKHEGRIEINSLTGNLAWHDGQPLVHVHVSACEESAGAFGGHLVEARVAATMEISIIPTSSRLTRLVDENIGLPLLEFPDIGKA